MGCFHDFTLFFYTHFGWYGGSPNPGIPVALHLPIPVVMEGYNMHGCGTNTYKSMVNVHSLMLLNSETTALYFWLKR